MIARYSAFIAPEYVDRGPVEARIGEHWQKRLGHRSARQHDRQRATSTARICSRIDDAAREDARQIHRRGDDGFKRHAGLYYTPN